MNLLCPICHEHLSRQENQWKCKNGHAFDQARQGYLHLAASRKKQGGDSAQMVKARTEFLETGAYDFLRDALIKRIEESEPDLLVDIGCGEGWYTRAFSKLVPHVLGIDLSKEAVKHAAGQDKRALYVVQSIYQIPLPDDCADMVVSIFTPIPTEEILRVLKPGGIFIQAGPGEDHLKELKEVLYEKVRLNGPLERNLPFQLEKVLNLKQIQDIHNPASLLNMTPYLHRSPKEGLERVYALEHLNVTFSFEILIWKKS
jgi:23S rRNA (guanine745-N1)-methyltransferase